MDNRLIKSRVLNGLLLALVVVSTIWAGVTTYDTLKLRDNAIKDSAGTTRIHIGSTNALTGNLTTTGTLGLLSDSAPRTNITPVAAGALIYNSADKEVCVSTGTTKTTWTTIASTTNACSH